MKVIVKSFSVNTQSWSNKYVAETLNKILDPKKPDQKFKKLNEDQEYEFKSTFGKIPKLPATFKQIYDQFKQMKTKPYSIDALLDPENWNSTKLFNDTLYWISIKDNQILPIKGTVSKANDSVESATDLIKDVFSNKIVEGAIKSGIKADVSLTSDKTEFSLHKLRIKSQGGALSISTFNMMGWSTYKPVDGSVSNIIESYKKYI